LLVGVFIELFEINNNNIKTVRQGQDETGIMFEFMFQDNRKVISEEGKVSEGEKIEER
jgi:hypothetical protein